jgi:hypothetical protein
VERAAAAGPDPLAAAARLRRGARATGESTWRIIGFEILPNLTAIIASGFVGTVVFTVLLEITLAFVGINVSEWNWGTVLYWAQSQDALAQNAWWWFVPAGLAIALLGTGLALLNFGIDEFVNPRLRSSGKVRVRTPRVARSGCASGSPRCWRTIRSWWKERRCERGRDRERRPTRTPAGTAGHRRAGAGAARTSAWTTASGTRPCTRCAAWT